MFGKSNYFFIFLFLFFLNSQSNSEDNISISPLINVDEIKPSYEETSPQSNNSENVTKQDFSKNRSHTKKMRNFRPLKS